MTITATTTPIPVTFKGTPQQLLDAFMERLQLSVDGTSFVISDIQPEGNQGPWLKNGTQWWVWDEDTSTYDPLDVSASVTDQIYVGDISDGPPDNEKYSLWLQLNGTVVNGLFYYGGTTAGWVKEASELVAGAVQPSMLAQQAPGSLITFDVNKNPIVLAPGNPGTALISTGNGLVFSAQTVTRGVPVFLPPYILASGGATAVDWTTASTLRTAGVPITASAVIITAEAGAYNENDIVYIRLRSQSGSPEYVAQACQQFGYSKSYSINQGIYPFANNNGILSVDYEVDVHPKGEWVITIVGYIS